MRTLALFLVACGAAPQVAEEETIPRQEEVVVVAQPCPISDLSALLDFVGFASAEDPAEYAADLDGDGTLERVVHAQVEAQSEQGVEFPDLEDHLIAFACVEGTWTESVHAMIPTETDQGTYDCRMGITDIEVQRVVAVDVLIVHSEACQGSYDPRWLEERVTIFSQRQSELAEVFSCAAVEQSASGPCRAGTNTSRDIQIEGPRITVEQTRSRDSGVCGDEGQGEDEDEYAEDEDEETFGVTLGAYTWNGMEFVASVDVCH